MSQTSHATYESCHTQVVKVQTNPPEKREREGGRERERERERDREGEGEGGERDESCRMRIISDMSHVTHMNHVTDMSNVTPIHMIKH